MAECGDCTYCCKLLGIRELDKPAGTWCSHCDIGHGCKIYPDRPQSCKDFHCLWLKLDGPIESRPDKSKVVLVTLEDENLGGYVLQAYIPPERQFSWLKDKFVKLAVERCLEIMRIPIIMMIGNKRRIIMPDDIKVKALIENTLREKIKG